MSELSLGQIKGLPVNSNVVTVPSGHTLYAPGHVLQVVSGTLKTPTTSTATTYTSFGLTASITPKFASSKIFVIVSLAASYLGVDAGRRARISVFRDSTNIADATSPGSRSTGFGSSNTIVNLNQMNIMSPSYLDSPNTTSTIQYSVQYAGETGDALYVNRTWQDADNSLYTRGVSSITVMEIAQ